MRLSVFCAAAWMISLTHGALGYAQSSARLAGIIQDRASAGIGGATVKLISLDRVLQTNSLANGSFEFASIPLATYEMEVTADGFVKQKFSVDFGSNATMPPRSIILEVGNTPDMETCGPHPTLKYATPGSTNPRLSGVIHDFYGEKPVVRAEVTVWSADDHQSTFRTYSDQAGRFTFENVTAGRYDIRISRRGYSAAEIKDLLIPRENGVSIDMTVLQNHKIVICQ